MGDRSAATEAQKAARESRRGGGETATFFATDRAASFVEMAAEAVETPYAFIAIFTPVPKGNAVRRFLHVG